MVEERVPGVVFFPQPAGIFDCRGRECKCEQMSSMAEESAIVDVKPEVYLPIFVICFLRNLFLPHSQLIFQSFLDAVFWIHLVSEMEDQSAERERFCKLGESRC